ncbi:hypothetical protein HIMB5_00011990 [alpha proteobacterium HIMB5]|nr:hypothetical protein HIMB5_00011990 [alpha proteobacterium HIMB5]
MSWLKKFIDYSKTIDKYLNLCTCPAHTEYQTAIIYNSSKKLKLDLEILKEISKSNPTVPEGIHFSNLDNENKKKIFENLTDELCELDEKFVTQPKNIDILIYLMRAYKHYGDISKFESDILYKPISKIYFRFKNRINSG